VGVLDWFLGRRSPSPVGKPEWQGVIVRCDPCERTAWNIRVVADCLVEGLRTEYPAVKISAGRVQVRVGGTTRIERLTAQGRRPAGLADLRPGIRVEIGFFDFTEQADPVAIYPDSLLLLS
jgi:hypothetical protein